MKGRVRWFLSALWSGKKQIESRGKTAILLFLSLLSSTPHLLKGQLEKKPESTWHTLPVPSCLSTELSGHKAHLNCAFKKGETMNPKHFLKILCPSLPWTMRSHSPYRTCGDLFISVSARINTSSLFNRKVKPTASLAPKDINVNENVRFPRIGSKLKAPFWKWCHNISPSGLNK